jgi:hypothetical protein
MKLTSRDVVAIAEELRPGFEAAILKPPPVQVIPFENAIEAYERIAGGQGGPKQVLTFSQPAGTTEARKRNG